MKTNKLLSVVLTLCVLLAAFSLTAPQSGARNTAMQNPIDRDSGICRRPTV